MQNTNAWGQPIGQPLPHWQPPPHQPREIITGRFCRLEPLHPEQHAPALYAANQLDPDDRSWTYLPYGPFATFEAYKTWLQQSATTSDPLFFTIIAQHTGQPAGLASYLRFDTAVGAVEVGHLKYSALLQKTPAATEAMFLMMQTAFANGYRRYEWKCDALNEPSCAAALRLGFRFEGIFRQARVYKGRNRDTAWYAITDTDWPALQTAFTAWLAQENFDEAGRQRQRLEAFRA